MWYKCIPTAVIGYVITLSIARKYGRKHGYKVNASQEMIAMGTSNIFAGFFHCIPAAASVTRSDLQERAGGKTQVCH
jgi:MFS superfamily sulfate permease-like transporter